MTTCTSGVHTCQWHDDGSRVDALLEGYNRGESLGDLAPHFGKTAQTCRKVLAAHGVRIRNSAEQRRVGREAQLAICTGAVHVCLWAGDRDVARLLATYAAGETLTALAARFDIAPATARYILVSHGVRIRSAADQRRTGRQAQVATCTSDQHSCPWSPEYDVEAILQSYAEGSARRQIARDFVLAPDTVGRILEAHGVQQRTRQNQMVRVPIDLDATAQARRAWVPLQELAEGAGITRQALTRRLEWKGYTAERLRPSQCTRAHHTCRWTRTVDVRALLARYAAGASQRELAMHFPVGVGTVGRILEAHGVRKRSASEQLASPASARRRRAEAIRRPGG